MISRNNILRFFVPILVVASIGTPVMAEALVLVNECTGYIDLDTCSSPDTSSCTASWDIPVNLRTYLVYVTRSDTACGATCADNMDTCYDPDDCGMIEKIIVPKSNQGVMSLCPVTAGWTCYPIDGAFVCEGPKADPVEFLVSPRIGRTDDLPAQIYADTGSINQIDQDPGDDVPTIIDTTRAPASSWWSMWLLALVLLGSIIFFVMRLRRSPAS